MPRPLQIVFFAPQSSLEKQLERNDKENETVRDKMGPKISPLPSWKNKKPSAQLVEQSQWGKLHTWGLYWWQWKNNWNSKRVKGLSSFESSFFQVKSLKTTARQSLSNSFFFFYLIDLHTIMSRSIWKMTVYSILPLYTALDLK